MSETFGLRLTCSQRLVASDLLPELADRLMLDTRNERTIPLTQKQIERLRDAASKAIGDAPTGTVRNSLRHIVDKSSDLLTRESAAKEVMRLKVTLVGSDPLIWRRIETHDCSLATLHDIIQVAMGWEDYHLHRFQVGQKQYGTPDPMDADWRYWPRRWRFFVARNLPAVCWFRIWAGSHSRVCSTSPSGD